MKWKYDSAMWVVELSSEEQ